MENPEPKKLSFSSAFISLKENKAALYRMWLALASIYTISFLLGFGIFIISIGAFFAIKRIMIYWQPSRAWLANTFGLKVPAQTKQNKSILYQRLYSIYQVGISLIYVLIGSFTIKLGIDILLQDGFLGQNLIYSIFFK